MKLKKTITAAALSLIIAGGATAGLSLTHNVPSAAAASAQSIAQADALKTLMSFYKPALQGQFPGSMKGLTVGVSTRQDVIDQIGKAPSPGKDADAFDFYGADMGHPGYAISYKLNKIKEMRYFGTNVERQHNIGGITQKMLIHAWGMPNDSHSFKTGKITQKKVSYVRGKYQLDFIFNSSTDLDHVNLKKKAL